MAFWLHEHRVLLALRFLAPRYKIMLIGVICGMMVAVWTFIFFLPARTKLQQELRAQHDLTQQNTAFETVANKLAQVTAACEKLETQIKSFDIQPATVHESIDFLMNLLRNHRILCKNIQPQQKKEKKEKKHEQKEHIFFDKEYCTLTLVGSFTQMLSFLDEIKLSKRLITFKTVDLVRGKDNTVKVTAVVRIASLIRSGLRSGLQEGRLPAGRLPLQTQAQVQAKKQEAS